MPSSSLHVPGHGVDVVADQAHGQVEKMAMALGLKIS
jgi:hypothetical protein